MFQTRVGKEENSEEDVSADEEESEGGDTGAEEVVANGDVQDELTWEEMQKDLRKENKLETKSKETHLVHCPHFPSVS